MRKEPLEHKLANITAQFNNSDSQTNKLGSLEQRALFTDHEKITSITEMRQHIEMLEATLEAARQRQDELIENDRITSITSGPVIYMVEGDIIYGVRDEKKQNYMKHQN